MRLTVASLGTAERSQVIKYTQNFIPVPLRWFKPQHNA